MRTPARVLRALSAGLVVAWPAFAGADGGAPDPRDAPLLAACGRGDPVLAAMAARLAHRRLAGGAPPSAEEVALELRLAGETHPWPRWLTLSGDRLERAPLVSRVEAFAKALPPGARRCGAASVTDERGHEAVVVLAVSVVAEAAPIPKRVRPGAWVTVDARLLRPADGARVVVLGPSGPPRPLTSSLHDGRVVARFAADRPGRFHVQVLANLEEGPRPVLEAVVTAGDARPSESEAPGADATGPTRPATLLAMLNAARASEGLPPLALDADLSAVAQRHAERMAKAGRLAHGAGDDDPAARLARAGVETSEVGENVAHAASLPGAHRVVWVSAAHRATLLSTRYREVGVGVAEAADGSTWIAELFARR